MSFRIEEKMLFRRSDFLKLKEFIFKSKGKKLYPKRKIQSIYFDNKNFQSYKESEDGILPRKKIRIRSYDKFNSQNLEIKISSVEGKFKKTYNITKDKFLFFKKNGFYDHTYGLLYPVTKVSYIRHYFEIGNNIRITIDHDMLYESYENNSLTYNDIENLILEVKLNKENFIKDLETIIPFTRLRVSKYCSSIESLFQ